MRAYKLRKYTSRHNQHGDPAGFGFAIGVPAEVARQFPDGQRFEFREGVGGQLVFSPVKEDPR